MGWLIVGRKKGEEIELACGGETVRIAVQDVQGKQVVLGVNAPKSVSIMRHELMGEHEELDGFEVPRG